MESPVAEKEGTGIEPPQPSISAHVRGLWLALRSRFFSATVVAILGVLGTGVFMRFRAEDNLLCIFLAYLPVWVLALPLLVTMAAGIFFACWRSVLASLTSAVLLVLWLSGYSFKRNVPRGGGDKNSLMLSVMTYNRGQGSEQVLIDCAASCHPDVAVFQDAGHRQARLAGLPVFAQNRHSMQDGEYVLLSRWPLLENQSLILNWSQVPSGIWRAGTRSVIDWSGRRVVIYNIHLPTPRDVLFWYAKHGTFLYGVLGFLPGTPLHARHEKYQAYWGARVELTSQIIKKVLSETEPVIVMGDFNMPPLGISYQHLTRYMQNAHCAAGAGFGYTFPSDFKSIGRIVTPWVRIDHIFASSQWRILSCSVCSGHISQHLPLEAVVALNR